MKILVVTPKFPYPMNGACELDRALGIQRMIAQGHDVYLISKIYSEGWMSNVEEARKKLGITIVPVLYKHLDNSFKARAKKFLGRILHPLYLDGAAYEYAEPNIRNEFIKALKNFKPDLVWCDYTYLWPLYKFARARGVPIATRSINFEAIHFLDEDGASFLNYIKSLPKFLTEWITARQSDILFAITPKEEKMYRKIGAKNVAVLPLRGLPRELEYSAKIRDRLPLNVFFSGSTYNVSHNRAALEFLLAQIVPRARKSFSGQFVFNIFGSKVPPEFDKYFGKDVVLKGYVPREDLNRTLDDMDISLVPSLYGEGMQQKIFEPLVRGFPEVASLRGIADYPFEDGEHFLAAKTADEFVECLGKLRDVKLRERLAKNAKDLSRKIFSEKSIDDVVARAFSLVKQV